VTELPHGWTQALVGDLVEEAHSGFPSGRHNSAGMGIPHLRPMNVSREGRIDLQSVKYVEGGADARIRHGEVLFNNTNSPELVGKTAYFDRDGEWAYSNHMTRLRPSAAIEGRFLAVQLHWLWMSGFYKSILSHHVNQASVATKTLLTRVEVLVPPLAEQRRIVTAIEEQFSRLDEAEAILRRSRLRLPSLRQRMVEAAMSHDWPRAELGDIAEIVGGITKDTKRQQDPSLKEVPYLRVANVQRGRLDLSHVTMIRVPSSTAERLALRPGDVLFNEGGDRDKLGRGWVWSGEIEECIHQNHVFRARLHYGFEPRFVSWWGNSFGQDWFWEHGRQTTNLASISLSTLKRFPVPAPPIEEQRAAVETIEAATTSIDHLDRSMELAGSRATTLRRAILAQAFGGELVPQDPADEPASLLLERLAAERPTRYAARRVSRRSRVEIGAD
jgi:type I restriction enzyme S subunit